MKNILVTGGAGYIGSHTCLTLLEKQYRVFVIDSFINSSPESLKRVGEIYKMKNNHSCDFLNIFKADICDKKLLNDIFQKILKLYDKVDGVIHFAGLKSVEESINNPISYWDANVKGSINLLDVMNNHNCHNIVFSSSASIYGKTSLKKVKESSIIEPNTPYGTTKMIIENFLKNIFYSHSDLWRIANLRYFNPIGAHETGLIGENPVGMPNNIFPIINNVAIKKLKELRIFGSDWPTKDGTGVRDFIHVMDVAEGHIRTLEFLFKNKPQIVSVNLGTGKGTSVLELVNTFSEINRVEIPYRFSQRRKGDIGILIADNSLIRNLLNWEPKRNLIEMCQDGWKWQTLNPEGF